MTEQKSAGLKKTINLSKGISLTIGSIIGSGLLALPGIAYVRYGSASLIAWITTALMILPFSIIFSDLSAKFPSAGGICEFTRRAFGDTASQIMAFIIAGTWPIGIPILALIGAYYVARVFGIAYCFAPLIALTMLLAVSALNVLGGELSGNVQRAVVAATVVLLTSVIILAIPRTPVVRPEMDPLKVWEAMSLIFWAYLGFENVTFLSEEFRNPKRDVFLSMIFGLICIVFLYVGLSYVVIGLLKKSYLTEVTPVIEVIDRTGGRTAGLVAGVVSILIVFINLNAWVWGASRQIYSASRGGMLPAFLSRLNRYSSPYASILSLLAIWAIVLGVYSAFSLSLAEMFRFANQNFAVMYFASVLAYSKVNGGIQRVFGLATLSVIVAFMFTYGYALLYPVALSIAAICYARSRSR